MREDDCQMIQISETITNNPNKIYYHPSIPYKQQENEWMNEWMNDVLFLVQFESK